MNYTIEIDTRNLGFIIKGEIDSILSNDRIKMTLKRLDFVSNSTSIFISYQEGREIETLEQLKRLFKKNNIECEVLSGQNNELVFYENEIKNFKKFALKAKSIRNNEFENDEGLIENFREFQNLISIKLERTLYELQLLSAFHMTFAQNSCNFSVPGSGKTSIVYAAYAYLKNLPHDDDRHVDNIVIIGPISSFRPWETEYLECFGVEPKSFRLSGNAEVLNEGKLEHLYSARPSELTLIYHGGVDKFRDDLVDFLSRNKTMLVVDEAHKIKNPNGVWGKSVVKVSEKAVARVALTGTPVPNGYQDLFNIFKFIYPYKYKEVLGFSYPNLENLTTSNKLESSNRIDKLKKNISPFFIRIKKDDLKLPPIEEALYRIDMSPYQREIYDFIESKYISHFKGSSSGTVKDVINKAKLIRLRQAATNPSLLAKPLIESLGDHISIGSSDSKTIFLTDENEYIDDTEFFWKIKNYSSDEIPIKFVETLNIIKNEVFDRQEKCIIWTIFVDNAKKLSEYLTSNGYKNRLLIGEIPQDDREKTIELFNSSSNRDFSIVIANPFSVAESISLHKGCHNAIYLERDYNCSNFIQSKDRIHRVGLNPNQITNYYYIIAVDSIDEVIHEKLEIKIERMESIINDDIPLFRLIDDDDESDIIKGLMKNYAERSKKI